MRLVWGIVTSVEAQHEDVQRLEVSLDDGSTGIALAYSQLVGRCEIADRVLVNTTGVDLDLGTGGYFFVAARAGDSEGVVVDTSSGGHVMKLRYTPLQTDVMVVEEQGSPHHDVMRSAEGLAGMPVACCGLHSQVPLVAASIKSAAPEITVAYVMSDQAALPIALSDVVRASVDVGLIDLTVTCGHSFGGMLEAVNVHSGLLAARHVGHADVAILAIGPGVVGTATPFGHGGIAQGESINAVAALGGVPIAALRVSFADPRPRHRGVSHHTLSALTRVALACSLVAIPSVPEEYADAIETDLEDAGVWKWHTPLVCEAGRSAPPGMRGVEVKTMGRSLEEDPSFFAAAFAVGEACVRVSRGEVVWPPSEPRGALR